MSQDQWAESLLNQYGRSLVRYTSSLLKDEAAARDVVEICFGEIQKLEQKDLEGVLPGFLYRQCRSRALDMLNRRKLSGIKEPTGALVDFSEVTLSGTDADQQLRKLHAEMLRLSPRHQEVLRLKFGNGLRFQEIADIIGASPQVVSQTISEAVYRLQAAIKQKAEPSPQIKVKHGAGR